jgi:hypothetical protein
MIIFLYKSFMHVFLILCNNIVLYVFFQYAGPWPQIGIHFDF